MKIKKMFDDFAKKFGTVIWEGIELALTEFPCPYGTFDGCFFSASAMDKDGNLWDVNWYSKPDANKCDDYASQVADWDKPDFVEMVDKGYYLRTKIKGDKNMKKLILKTEKLNNLDTILIGNGGQSRLDIFLDLDTGEIWADEFYDHEANSCSRYYDDNIIQIGRARNGIIEDDETGELDPDNKCWWSIIIYAPDSYCSSSVELSGDYYNDFYDVVNVLDVIKMLYLE